MRYMTLLPFCVLLAGAEQERKNKMGDHKAVQLFAEISPANQATVYENATNLLPEEDDHVPAPSVPSTPSTPGVVERAIGSLYPSAGGSMGGICGAAVGGVSGPMGGICGGAAAGIVSGFFAGSKTMETQNKPDGVSVGTEVKSGQSFFIFKSFFSDSKK